MVTQKDLQDAFAALLNGDEAGRDRILREAKERDRRHAQARQRGAEYSKTKTPIKLIRGTDGVYRPEKPWDH